MARDFSTVLPAGVADAFLAQVKKEGTTKSQLLRKAAEEYLGRQSGGPSAGEGNMGTNDPEHPGESTETKKDKIVYIDSYAQAESLGVKPFDSLIGTVADISNPEMPVILALPAGHTLVQKDLGKFIMPVMQTYTGAQGNPVAYASDIRALKILMDRLYTRRPTLYLMKLEQVKWGGADSGSEDRHKEAGDTGEETQPLMPWQILQRIRR